jgi:hypothetical protein
MPSGGLFTSKQSASTQESKDPWAAQAPYLTQGFNAASKAMTDASNAPKPTDFVAGFNPEQLALFQKMLGYGANGAAGVSADAGAGLTTAGTSAATGALSGLNAFGGKDLTSSNIDAATKYADNAYSSGVTDAAMRDAERAVNENYLPQVAQGAAASGNRDSSKRAITEGIALRGLAEKRQDLDATQRSQLFSQGLQLAQGDNGTMLDALKSGALAGTGAATAGVGATGAGIDQQKGIYDIANAGSDALTNAQQQTLNDMLAKYQFGVSSPFDPLNAYWQIVGSGNWGGQSSGTSSGTSTPSMMSQISALLGAGGSLLGGKKA